MNKENIYKLENIEDIKMFIIGGNATITLESETTGRWFTYKIRKAKKSDENSPFFVSVLTGSDNENSYTYMGVIFNNDGRYIFRLTKKSRIGKDAFSYIAFNFFFNLTQSNKMNDKMSVYHRGVCGRCGRTLTTPESLIIGLGPYCRGVVEKSTSDVRKKKLQNINKQQLKIN